ncbi:hypothetical protein C8Q79DRAFT_1007539 [Trametes meyenii]|nr:hypothetical protein C8Q79DRAFT_1007539 [Trametes meyenii]
MIPRHANPYLLPAQTTVVSRAALRDPDDELDPVDTADPERTQMLAQLENILKRSIANVLPNATHDSEATGDAPRKKKRRKVVEPSQDDVREEQSKQDEPVAVPFRLLSGTSQPKPIMLAPKAPPVIIGIGPAYEDTEEEAQLRVNRAQAAAVDFKWVIEESRKPTVPPPGAPSKITRISAPLPTPQPPLLVLERTRPPTNPPHVSRGDLEESPIAPSPHIHETSCCPVLAAENPSPGSIDARKKRKRRRGKSSQKPALQPMFWKPTTDMGGKSAGYAWGYSGSWPAEEGTTPRYYRDTMRKAVFA